MAEHSRYSISNEGAGVEGHVLKNKLQIKDQDALSDTEALLLNDAYAHYFALLESGKITFDLPLLFKIHEYFLGTLYTWAGKVRKMDISKDGILFAPVAHIEKSLKGFEKLLRKNIPSKEDTKKQIAEKLATIHNELNAVHPFREGNGRTIRLFLDLLAGSLVYNPIDWSKKPSKQYLEACAAGMVRNHKPMERIIYLGLVKRR